MPHVNEVMKDKGRGEASCSVQHRTMRRYTERAIPHPLQLPRRGHKERTLIAGNVVQLQQTHDIRNRNSTRSTGNNALHQ